MSRAALAAALAAAFSGLAGCARPAERAAPPPEAAAVAPAAEPAVAAPATPLCLELPGTIIPLQWLLLPATDVRGRRPFRADAVFARYLLDPDAPPPLAGESLTGETGESQSWEARTAEPDGTLSGDFAWAYAEVASPAARVMLAELAGAGALFVNGDGAAGDPYRAGFGVAPVALEAGVNRLYVGGVRDGFRLVLREPEHALLLELSDTTAPDLVAGEAPAGEIAVTLINASLEAVPALTLATGSPARVAGAEAEAGAFARLVMPADELPGLPPLGVLKLPARFAWAAGAPPPVAGQGYELVVSFGGHPGEPERSETLRLSCKGQGVARRVTRRSPIDDSLQEYALLEPAPAALAHPPGLVLTLHGAGVDALGQAASYAPKAGWWIVAPTNRRPFGFDWQDWGRTDAYETLEHALALSGADASRVALTGHSMGGHGSWHLAVNDADRFLAVGPSAGWSSFDSYPGRPAGALAELWHAADGAGDTAGLLPNLVNTPAYVLHGEADDNVPASEGRALHEALTAAVEAASARGLPAVAPQLHVQPGAGHWWDGEAAPGADCVDWPPLFALFDGAAAASRQPPASEDLASAALQLLLAQQVLGRPVAAVPARFEWICADPAVDSRHHWIAVVRPREYGRPVRIAAGWDAATRHVELQTDNAELIVLYWPDGEVPDGCTLDGQSIVCGTDLAGTRKLRDIGDVLERVGEEWRVWPMDTLQFEGQGWLAALEGPALKSPARSGPFKRAFDNRFVLVYGTAGTPRESAELLARARYDSEVWRYRGNGRAEVWSDRQFLAPENLRRMQGRNAILYGNRDSNLAFQALVPPDCPLVAERGRIRLGEQTWEGDDLAALCVYPRVGERRALLGLFADSGPAGSRLGYTLAPFVSGVGYPDFALVEASVLASGDGGVRAAGWFDGGWRGP